MKKYFFIILILFVFLSVSRAEAVITETEPFSETNLFAPPAKFITTPSEQPTYEFRDLGKNYSPLNESRLKNTSTTPPLKKLRLKISKFKNQRKEKDKDNNKVITANDTPVDEITDSESINEVSTEQVSSEEQQNIILNCDDMFYSHVDSVMQARGNVVVEFKEQHAKLYADELNFYNNDNIIVASGNVKVVKEEQEIFGDYIKVDLNTENILVDKPHTTVYRITIEAKKSCLVGNDLIQDEGTIEVTDDFPIKLPPQGKLRYLKDFMVKEENKTYLTKKIESDTLKIKVGKITLDSKKDNNILYLKDAEFFLKGKKILKIPHIRFCTNKNADYIEGNYPEIGSIQDVGTYVGPGWAFDLPKGATLKVAPTFVVKNKIGFGGLAKFKNGTNETELYYGTPQHLWVLRGKQILDDNLYFQYGANHYLDDWFLGKNKAKYGFNLVYGRSFESDSFLYKNFKARMTTRTDLGLFQDARRDKYYEKLIGNDIGTFRARTMLEGMVDLYNYTNEEKLTTANLYLVAQGSAAIYGTGDTQFIGRAGPMLRTQYRRWMQHIGYFQSVYSDNTPMPVFDKYRYGKANIYAHEYIRLCKYLTVALIGAYNLSDDSYGKKRFSECGIYASIGPDDLRLDVGYDFIREQAYVNVQTLMNAKGTKVSYDKLVIKNIDNCHTNTDDNSYESAGSKNNYDKLLEYAVTEDISEYANEL